MNRLDKQGYVSLAQAALRENCVSDRKCFTRTPNGLEELEKVVLTSLWVLERDYCAIEELCQVEGGRSLLTVKEAL